MASSIPARCRIAAHEFFLAASLTCERRACIRSSRPDRLTERSSSVRAQPPCRRTCVAFPSRETLDCSRAPSVFLFPAHFTSPSAPLRHPRPYSSRPPAVARFASTIVVGARLSQDPLIDPPRRLIARPVTVPQTNDRDPASLRPTLAISEQQYPHSIPTQEIVYTARSRHNAARDDEHGTADLAAPAVESLARV